MSDVNKMNLLSKGMTTEQHRILQSNMSLLVGVSSLVVFLIIAAYVLTNEAQGFDAQITIWIYDANLGPAFTSIAFLASEYGRGYFWIAVVALMLIFGKRDMKLLAIELSILFIIGIAAGGVAKYVTFRPRPFVTISGVTARMLQDSNSSFPSGHALIVSMGAIFALANFRGRARMVALLLGIEAAVVSLARILLGLHYFLDVVAGVFLGSSIALLGVFVLERYFSGLVQWATSFADRRLGILPEIF
jgi:membrane-associated phospholipid phosphatase